MKLPTSAYVVSVPSAIHQIQKVPIESARLIHPHFISPVAVNQSVGTWPKKKKNRNPTQRKKKPEQEKNLWKLNSVSWGKLKIFWHIFIVGIVKEFKHLALGRQNWTHMPTLLTAYTNRMYRKNLNLYIHLSICTFACGHKKFETWPKDVEIALSIYSKHNLWLSAV